MTLRTSTRRGCAAILLVTAGTGLTACGSDSKDSASAKAQTFSNVKITNATDLKKKPGISIPDTLPPKSLVKQDIVVGKGPLVKSSDALTAQYVGVGWSSNQQFDASWDRGGSPTTFNLTGGVIKGWTQGLPGMHVGGRRLLIVPPALGYGEQGQGTNIPGGETLVFVVDATKAAKAPKTSASSTGASSGISQEQLQQALQAQAGGAGGGAQVQTAP